MKKACMFTAVMTSFNRCAVESILIGDITTWYGICSAQQDKNAIYSKIVSAKLETSEGL